MPCDPAFSRIFFDGQGAKTVQVSRADGKVIVSFVVLRTALNNPEALTWFRELARGLSQEVFEGVPVKIHLCDETLKVMKTVP